MTQIAFQRGEERILTYPGLAFHTATPDKPFPSQEVKKVRTYLNHEEFAFLNLLMFYRSPLAQSETGCDFHQTCCREYRHHRCQKSPPERVHDRTVIAELVPSLHKVADNALREIAHLHSQIDYSLHLILSPRDCKLGISSHFLRLASIRIPDRFQSLNASDTP